MKRLLLLFILAFLGIYLMDRVQAENSNFKTLNDGVISCAKELARTSAFLPEGERRQVLQKVLAVLLLAEYGRILPPELTSGQWEVLESVFLTDRFDDSVRREQALRLPPADGLAFDGSRLTGSGFGRIDQLIGTNGQPIALDRRLPTRLIPLDAPSAARLQQRVADFSNRPESAPMRKRTETLYGAPVGSNLAADGVFFRPYAGRMDDFYYRWVQENQRLSPELNFYALSESLPGRRFHPLTGLGSPAAVPAPWFSVSDMLSGGAMLAVEDFKQKNPKAGAGNPFRGFAARVLPFLGSSLENTKFGDEFLVSRETIRRAIQDTRRFAPQPVKPIFNDPSRFFGWLGGYYEHIAKRLSRKEMAAEIAKIDFATPLPDLPTEPDANEIFIDPAQWKNEEFFKDLPELLDLKTTKKFDPSGLYVDSGGNAPDDVPAPPQKSLFNVSKSITSQNASTTPPAQKGQGKKTPSQSLAQQQPTLPPPDTAPLVVALPSISTSPQEVAAVVPIVETTQPPEPAEQLVASVPVIVEIPVVSPPVSLPPEEKTTLSVSPPSDSSSLLAVTEKMQIFVPEKLVILDRPSSILPEKLPSASDVSPSSVLFLEGNATLANQSIPLPVLETTEAGLVASIDAPLPKPLSSEKKMPLSIFVPSAPSELLAATEKTPLFGKENRFVNISGITRPTALMLEKIRNSSDTAPSGITFLESAAKNTLPSNIAGHGTRNVLLETPSATEILVANVDAPLPKPLLPQEKQPKLTVTPSAPSELLAATEKTQMLTPEKGVTNQDGLFRPSSLVLEKLPNVPDANASSVTFLANASPSIPKSGVEGNGSLTTKIETPSHPDVLVAKVDAPLPKPLGAAEKPALLTLTPSDPSKLLAQTEKNLFFVSEKRAENFSGLGKPASLLEEPFPSKLDMGIAFDKVGSLGSINMPVPGAPVLEVVPPQVIAQVEPGSPKESRGQMTPGGEVPIKPLPPIPPSQFLQGNYVAVLTPDIAASEQYLSKVAANDTALSHNAMQLNRVTCYLKWLSAAVQPLQNFVDTSKKLDSKNQAELQGVSDVTEDELGDLLTLRTQLLADREQFLKERGQLRVAIEGEPLQFAAAKLDALIGKSTGI